MRPTGDPLNDDSLDGDKKKEKKKRRSLKDGVQFMLGKLVWNTLIARTQGFRMNNSY